MWQHQSGPVLQQLLLSVVQGSPHPPQVLTENSEKVEDEGD